MELNQPLAIIAAVVLIIMVGTVIFAIVEYILYKIREKKTRRMEAALNQIAPPKPYVVKESIPHMTAPVAPQKAATPTYSKPLSPPPLPKVETLAIGEPKATKKAEMANIPNLAPSSQHPSTEQEPSRFTLPIASLQDKTPATLGSTAIEPPTSEVIKVVPKPALSIDTPPPIPQEAPTAEQKRKADPPTAEQKLPSYTVESLKTPQTGKPTGDGSVLMPDRQAAEALHPELEPEVRPALMPDLGTFQTSNASVDKKHVLKMTLVDLHSLPRRTPVVQTPEAKPVNPISVKPATHQTAQEEKAIPKATPRRDETPEWL